MKSAQDDEAHRASSSLLWVDGVGYGYRRGGGGWSGLFSGVSCTVEPGEIVAVIGGRLAGKTSLLKIIAGLQRPTEGRVLFAGRDLWALSGTQRERLLGHEIVWANRVVKPDTTRVFKHVGMGLAATGHSAAEADRIAEEALERVGAQECAHSLCCELSFWQQTLVGVARGFAVRPRLFVIDDLLDALRTEDSNEALALLHELAETKPCCGVLISASSMEPVTLAHRIWSLRGNDGLELQAGNTKLHHLPRRLPDL